MADRRGATLASKPGMIVTAHSIGDEFFLSFDTLYVIAVPAAIGAVILIMLMLAVRRPGICTRRAALCGCRE